MKVLGNEERLQKELTAPRRCRAGFQGQSPLDAALISRSGQGGAQRASPTALHGLGAFAVWNSSLIFIIRAGSQRGEEERGI